jgi:hypothetical protein
MNYFHNRNIFSGPQFDLVARAKLTLDDTDDNIHTHDLVINNVGKLHKHSAYLKYVNLIIPFFRK